MVCIWLASQVAGVVAAPIAFCCRTTAVADDDACCPGLLPGQICPMHHTRAGERTCKMRDACGRADAGLVSLAGTIGLLPAAPPSVSAFVVGEPIDRLTPSTLSRADRPESPPPRR
jgi:hypothetical protein